MFEPSAKKFFLYGLAIAGLEEFISQGVLKGSYFLWVFTLLPFAVFLAVAGCVRALCRLVPGWRAVALYYLVSGAIGLAVEWFIIGLSPWSDRESPVVLIAVFHAGMFSFWGTVALGPHILLDARAEAAPFRRAFLWAFAALMAVTYVLTFAAKAAGAGKDVQFLASIGPIVLTFLALNAIYVPYFRSCRTPSAPATAATSPPG